MCPPQGCSAAPHSDENLFVWGATVLVNAPGECVSRRERQVDPHLSRPCASGPGRIAVGGVHASLVPGAAELKRVVSHGKLTRTSCLPAQGGIFSLRLTFTEAYPEKPPRVRFTSEVRRGLRTARWRQFASKLHLPSCCYDLSRFENARSSTRMCTQMGRCA